jgi:protein-tyrosine phosphatase
MDFDEILPELLVGSHPGKPRDIAWLQERHAVRGVLSLQTDADHERLGIDWPAMVARYEASGMAVARVPIADFDSADLRANLERAVAALDRLTAEGARTYLHCSLGIGRAPSVAIAYLTWSRGWGLDQAWRHVRERRNCSPSFEAIWLANRDRTRRAGP